MNKKSKWWNNLKYEESLDYYLASLLSSYGYDNKEVIIWYYNKNNKIIIFQSNYKYYLLKNNKIKEITEDDVWHNKSNFR